MSWFAAMNEPGGIPFRPDPGAVRAAARGSFVRAVAAMALAKTNKSAGYPAEVLKRHWRDDDAERVLKAISSPTDTSSFLGTQSATILPALAPASASARLMRRGKTIDLSGVQTVKLPFISASGRPASVPWIAEGAPAHVVMMTTNALTLGPVHKLMVIATLTQELANASAAEQIIGDALSIATTQSLDVALFSNVAATAISPPGILNGLANLTSSGGTGVEGVADDVAKLAKSIANAGIDPSDMVLITNAEMAVKLEILSSPKFDNDVLTSVTIPDGWLIGIAPAGFVSAYGADAVSVEVSTVTTLHSEDTTPLPIIGDTGTPAAPSHSLYQQSHLALKVRGQCTWLTHPGSVSAMTACAW